MPQQNNKSWLIFIDTNIFLDFYRLGGDNAKKQLEALERHKDSIIICDQVHMEFLKNRQKVILQSIEGFKAGQAATPPKILNDLTAAKVMKNKNDEANTQYKKLKEKLLKFIQNPQGNDIVFTSISRIIKHNGPYNLKRPDKRRYEIRERAEKRFLLGYPPRKNNDTSIGDAVNWEWIIECAKDSDQNHNILIVSRDSDYGAMKKTSPTLNDWLQLEFKERVSRTRKIVLTDKLTEALKKLNERVSPVAEKEEEELIRKNRQKVSCTHEPILIQNGRFDILYCKKCNKHLSTWEADLD